MVLKAAAWFLLLCALVVAGVPMAFSDGVGHSMDSLRRASVQRPCTPACTATCPGALTVNCRTGSDSTGITQPSVKTATDSDQSAGKVASAWPQVFTHVIDILPQLLWLLIAWVLIAALINALPADVFSKLIPNLTRFKAGSFELEFDLKRARAVEKSFRESFSAFTSAAQAEYDRQASIHQLQEVFLPEVVRHVESRLNRLPDEFRATVHVPDVVFKRFLYQLLDYDPSGGGRGRRFSYRYGIIGRSWRSRHSDFDNDAQQVLSGDRTLVVQSSTEKMGVEEEKIQAFIRGWSMTRSEAQQARRNRRSVLCVLLKVPKNGIDMPVGILYMDAEEENAFAAAYADLDPADAFRRFALELEKHGTVVALASAVNAVMAELRKGAANLEIT